jgi:hypothetical protein
LEKEPEQIDVNQKFDTLKYLISLDMIESANSGKRLKKKSNRIKLATITLSALITVMIGVSSNDFWDGWTKNLALILSALLTGINGWESFVKYETRSIQEHSNSTRLSMLYKDILLTMSGNNVHNLEKFEEFKTNYQNMQEEYMEERKSIKEIEENKRDN